MLKEDDNASDYFKYYKKHKDLLRSKWENMEEDQRDLVSKDFDTQSRKKMLSKCTPKDGLLVSQLLLFLKEVQLSK